MYREERQAWYLLPTPTKANGMALQLRPARITDLPAVY